jgi:glucose/arabinose dehydrogenase
MRRITLAVALIAISAIAVSAQRGRKPVNLKDLPAPFATPSVRNNPTVVPKPEGAALTAPSGFVVEEFMDFAGMRPRFMMLGPSNEILISDTSGNGSVFVIKDGVRTAIIEKLDRPYGLALKGDQLYVAEPTSVKVFTYDVKAMRVTSPGKEIIALPGMNTGHTTRTLAFNRDGSKLYLSVGSQSNINLGEDPMRAAVHRFNPDGTGHETIVTLSNAVGMRFYPGTDDLWVTVHERDELGDDPRPITRRRSRSAILRLADRLHRSARRAAPQRCRHEEGREHALSRRDPRRARRSSRYRVLHRQDVPGEV